MNFVKKGTSLKMKWILFITVTIMIAVTVAMAINHLAIKKTLSSDNEVAITESAYHASTQVALGLESYEKGLQQLMLSVEQMVAMGADLQQIDAVVKSLEQSNEEYKAVYFMDFRDGLLHVSPPIDFDWDVRDSETFRTMNATPEMKWMDIYMDTITGELMTSLIAPIQVNGQLIGAVGFDIDFSAIEKIRSKVEEQSNAKLFIVDPNGLIVSSFKEGSNGLNLDPNNQELLEGSRNFVEDTDQFVAEFGWVSDALHTDAMKVEDVQIDEETYTGQTVTLEENNWKIIALTNDAIFNSKMAGFMKIAIFAVLIALVIGIISSYFLSRTILQMIMSLRNVISKTASGDFISELEVKSMDEMGKLGETYNEMLRNVRHLIQEVNANSTNIDDASNRLAIIAQENNATLTDISATVEVIANSSNDQADHMQNGTQALTILNDHIEQVKGESSTIKQEVKEAISLIDTGSSKVNELQTSYYNLEQSFSQVTTLVEQLNEKSKSISNVTEVISQITDQTNLLALNASIEAARAGEHGKGFAVVADEVRKLAEGSKNATIDIQQIITSILSETSKLVDLIQHTNTISADQKLAVSTVKSAIDDLSKSLQVVSQTVQQTNDSIVRMDATKNQVVEMIEEVSTMTFNVSSSTQEMASAIEEQVAATSEVANHTVELSQKASNLNEAVHKFKIK